jgi:hypothetical protein
MADNKNVMIPLSLMDKIIELLGYFDVSKYDPVIQLELHEVLRYLDIKKRRLGLRDCYAKVILAKNEDKRDDARIRYLKEKSLLREDSADLAY